MQHSGLEFIARIFRFIITKYDMIYTRVLQTKTNRLNAVEMESVAVRLDKYVDVSMKETF